MITHFINQLNLSNVSYYLLSNPIVEFKNLRNLQYFSLINFKKSNINLAKDIFKIKYTHNTYPKPFDVYIHKSDALYLYNNNKFQKISNPDFVIFFNICYDKYIKYLDIILLIGKINLIEPLLNKDIIFYIKSLL